MKVTTQEMFESAPGVTPDAVFPVTPSLAVLVQVTLNGRPDGPVQDANETPTLVDTKAGAPDAVATVAVAGRVGARRSRRRLLLAILAVALLVSGPSVGATAASGSVPPTSLLTTIEHDDGKPTLEWMRRRGRTPKIVRWVSRCARKGTNVIAFPNATGGARARRSYRVYVKSPNSTYPLRSSWETLPHR